MASYSNLVVWFYGQEVAIEPDPESKISGYRQCNLYEVLVFSPSRFAGIWAYTPQGWMRLKDLSSKDYVIK